MPTFGDFVQALDPSSPRKRPASRIRSFGDFVQSMDPSANSPGVRPQRPQPSAIRPPATATQQPVLRPGEFNSPPPPHPGLESPFQTSVAPVVGSPVAQQPAMTLDQKKEAVLGRPLTPFDSPNPPQLPHDQAWQQYMQTGRNPNLGPNAPYGIFSGGPQSIGENPGSSSLFGLQTGAAALSALNRRISTGETPRVPAGSTIGYANSIQSMGIPDDARAREVYGRTGFMPDTTVGGSYGQGGRYIPGDPRYEADVARDIGIAQRGGQREAILADMNRRPTGFIPPPPTPGGVTPESTERAKQYLLGRGAQYNPDSGQFRGSEGMVTQMTPDQRKAMSEGRRAYQEKRQGVKDARQVGVSRRALYKAEGRRLRQGNMSFEERLAMMNPAAAQGRMAAEAGQKTQADRFASDLQFRRDALAQQASEGKANRQNRIDAERLRAGLPLESDQASKTDEQLAQVIGNVAPSTESRMAELERKNPQAAQAIKDMQDRLRRQVYGQFYPIMNPFWSR